jgi:hypothetical protein
MSNVIPFKRAKENRRRQGNTLCRRGFHKWAVVNQPFDVKRGRLVTCFRCERCGAEKTEAR